MSTLIGAAQPASAALITNGSFESPVLTPGEVASYSGGSSAMPGWTVVGNEVLLIETTYSENSPPDHLHGMLAFNAQDGFNSVDITGNNNSGPNNGVEQVVATLAGQTYALSFYVGRAHSNNGNSAFVGPATVDLSINGGPRVSYTNSEAGPSGFVGWEQFTTSFTATSSSTSIAFLNGTPLGTLFAGLENIELSGPALPEPSSLVLLATGAVIVISRRLLRKERY